MPLFQIDIEKKFGTEFWSNRYHCDAASLAAADLIANSVATLEIATTDSRVTVTVARTRTAAPGDTDFIIRPINAPGNRDGGANALLPLFNVVRIDIPIPAGGRPSRKYLRGILTVANVGQFVLSSALASSVQGVYCDNLADITGLTDESGNPIGTPLVSNDISMRQLRRGSRRRTTPIITP